MRMNGAEECSRGWRNVYAGERIFVVGNRGVHYRMARTFTLWRLAWPGSHLLCVYCHSQALPGAAGTVGTAQHCRHCPALQALPSTAGTTHHCRHCLALQTLPSTAGTARHCRHWPASSAHRPRLR